MPARGEAVVFGLALEGDVALPGLDDAASSIGRPRVRIEKLSASALAAAWGDGPERRLLVEFEDPAGRPARSIVHRPGLGYRLHARGFGTALVAEDGAWVRCAPEAAEAGWSRFLVGRILPWVAVLRGLEPLHAGAVCHDRGACALVGPSGAGKSSLVAHLVLAGAGFMSDDVLTLDHSREGTLQAHPGPGLLAMRSTERARLRAADWAGLGRPLANGDVEKTTMVLPREPGSRALTGLYFVERAARRREVVRVTAPSPLLLLGASFNQSIQTPERLRRQLYVCGELAARVPVHRLCAGPGDGAAELASSLLTHLDENAANGGVA